MKFFASKRVGRGDFLFAVIGINVAFLAGVYWLSGRLSLMLELGFRTRPGLIGSEPATITLARAVSDALLLWFAIRRVRDTNHPGWWALALPALPLVLGFVGALVSLAGIIALFVMPGTVGPNRFGPDPRGWKSREQFDEQQSRLRSGEL